MILSDKKGVQQIVQSLAALQVQEVVVCPGSRNAPFIISFNRHNNFSCTSIRDERSAAFFALGKAIALNKPVVLLCTSGSAALNFAPAIVEAYYQRIPLIVITADRPQEWIGQGDGQTIHQSNIYHNYIRKSYQLNGDATKENELWYIRRCISEGLIIALQNDKGPVHFNVQLNEPLYTTEEISNTTPKVFTTSALTKQITNNELDALAYQFNHTNKIMILVGQHPKHSLLEKLLKDIAAYEQVIVLTESTANMYDENFINHIDRCITSLNNETAQALMPDLLITLGDTVVTKRLKVLLRKHSPALHWHIHPFEISMDTYQSLTNVITLKPYDFFQQIVSLLQPKKSAYKNNWINLKNKISQLHNEFVQTANYSDFLVFDKIFKAIPANYHLHIANSSPIRYAQLFHYQHIANTWCNRGTSGIDGCTSTAFGAASALPDKSFLLITGDVAFQYDKNAFWNNENIQNLKIIVINNCGGGIFRIIDGSKDIEECAEFLETTMKSNAMHIAAQHQWQYIKATDIASLQEGLNNFFLSDKPIILEVFTDADTNPKILEQYWHYLKN